jgi:hypothetical protein
MCFACDTKYQGQYAQHPAMMFKTIIVSKYYNSYTIHDAQRTRPRHATGHFYRAKKAHQPTRTLTLPANLAFPRTRSLISTAQPLGLCTRLASLCASLQMMRRDPLFLVARGSSGRSRERDFSCYVSWHGASFFDFGRGVQCEVGVVGCAADESEDGEVCEDPREGLVKGCGWDVRG